MCGDYFMDYDKLYRKFMSYCKTIGPKERLEQRNKHDARLNNDHLYTETHHIVPRSLGGDDSATNLVVLLPEEHLMAHKLRYKAYDCRQDFIAVRFVCNGLRNKGHIDKVTKLRLSKEILNAYSWIRTNSAEFRKIHGWQTQNGRASISESRKGTMPVKDAETGEMIGSVDTSHPKVLSGEWVHHTKGRKASEKERELAKKKATGLTNPNAHSITNDEYMQQTVEYIKEFCPDGRFVKSHYKRFCEENDLIYIINLSKHRWGGSFKKFIEELTKECAKEGIYLLYDRYYRGTEQKQKIAKAIASKCRQYNEDGSYIMVDKNVKN